jgi:lipopolysaccharide/colanic/teichoic acid biosynthesis glycosyltransferase
MTMHELPSRIDSNFHRFDRYLRRDDTNIARILHEVCPHLGEKYIKSPWKRAFDLSIGIPSSVAATPVVIALATAKLIEDGHGPFFVQKRASKVTDNLVDDLPIWKIRCMGPNSDRGGDNAKIAKGCLPEADPRNTRLGSMMRKHQLEELPQLYQVILGRMSLLGPRVLPSYEIDELSTRWSPKRFESWKQVYNSGVGLSGLYQTMGNRLKDTQDIYHMDAFYKNNASLGFDMYLVWRTALRLTKLK